MTDTTTSQASGAKKRTPAFNAGYQAGRNGEDDTVNPYKNEWQGWGKVRRNHWFAGWQKGFCEELEAQRRLALSRTP